MRGLILGLLASVTLIAASGSQPALAQSASGGFGLLGDSSTDEYRADDNRGGAYAATTLNWVELLVRHRGVDAGEWGSRNAPRRSGYAYNWALSGVRAADVVSGGQAAGLAQQVASGQVSSVLLMIGTNDFHHYNGTYSEIYNGSLAGGALQAKVDAIVANIAQALDITRAGAPGPLRLFVVSVADPANSALYQAPFPDAAKRARVTNAILAVNAGIQTVAAARDAAVIDSDALGGTLLGALDANGNLKVGGELISMVESGDEPHHGLLGDTHLGTILSGLMANHFIETFNSHGLTIQKFSDEELLGFAGIGAAEDEDNEPPTVQLTAPAGPSVFGSVVLAAQASDNIGVAGVQFKANNVNVGSEATSAPYSRTWNAANVAPGQHTLAAVARDTAGNTAIASRVVMVLDVAQPSVSISSPPNNALVSGAMTIAASASDNVGVAGVTFRMNGTALGAEDTQSPYSITVQTTAMQNGTVNLTASARDASGNTSTSSPVAVTINNQAQDTTNPTVAFNGPANGSTVSNTVTITAAAADNVGVAGVRFRLNGNDLGSEDTSAPYSVAWNTTAASNGSQVLTATARDAAGNTATSTITLNVLNVVNLPPEYLAASAYTISTGTHQSGNVASLAADDNNYLRLASTGSGTSRSAEVQWEFAGIVTPVSKLQLDMALKSSRANTSVSVSAYNFASGTWTVLSSFAVGTGETSRTLALPANVASYIGPGGGARIRVRSTTYWSSHSLYLDLARLAVTPQGNSTP